MPKYYYELKWPESLPDSQRNCEHIDKKELINKALDRLQDGLMESEIAYGKIDDINLLEPARKLSLIRLPILTQLNLQPCKQFIFTTTSS